MNEPLPAAPDSLVDVIYAAALTPAEWPAALGAVARFVAGDAGRAVGALTFVEGPSPGLGWLLVGVEGSDERAYAFPDATREHPLFVHGRALAEGFVGPSEVFAGSDDLARTTLAREFFADDGTIRGQSAVLHATDELLAAAHVLRPRSAGPWRDEAAARLRAVLAHLRRAVEIYARLRRARAQAEIDRALLDQMDVATIVLGATGAVTRSNRAATALLDRGDGVERMGAGVRCTAAGADAALRRAVREARGGRSDVVVVPRREGRPLLAFVMGLPEGGVAVLARDPEHQGMEAEELLQRVFALTPTESRVALRIAQGEGPAEVGGVLGMKTETVRTHLKRVFDKTSTTRQSQVVRLVLGEVPPLGE
jgi:DNA-binding CsgD family transcriptional regulator